MYIKHIHHISLVKEFYVSAKESENFIVQVRDKSVAFDRSAINTHFHLPNIKADDYMENGTDGHDLTEVIQRLCKPGTTWKLKDNSSEKVSFSYTELSRSGKAWYI